MLNSSSSVTHTHHPTYVEYTTITVEYPGFPRGGTHSRGGAQTYFVQNVCRKEFSSEGACISPSFSVTRLEPEFLLNKHSKLLKYCSSYMKEFRFPVIFDSV